MNMNRKKLNSIVIEHIAIELFREGSPIYCPYDGSFEYWFHTLEANMKFIKDFHGVVFGQDINRNRVCDIGYLKGSFFESESLLEDITFVQLCNLSDPVLYKMAKAITNKDGYIKEHICSFDKNIMFLKMIYIEPMFQDCGIGSYIIKNISKLLKFSIHLYPHSIIMEPTPHEKDDEGNIQLIQDEEIKKCFQAKLESFYRKCGFKRIRGTDYFIKKELQQ